MRHSTLKADILLVLAAAIWGVAFVAQRLGMEHMGPFLFNGLRFALGCLSLIPLILLNDRRKAGRPIAQVGSITTSRAGLYAGIALFFGASLQQIGLVSTTAGKAGFITGLYVILVPLIGLIWKQRPPIATWFGAIVAVAGLYLLSVTEDLTIATGDLYVLAGAIFWACHVLLIAWLSPQVDVLRLSAIQFAVCAAGSLLVAGFTETILWESIVAGMVPILYGGLLSVGVAYTLQVVAQRDAKPAHSAIILSMEGVFAAIGGWMLLGETLGLRALIGCALMLAGMLLTELAPFFTRRRPGVQAPQGASL